VENRSWQRHCVSGILHFPNSFARMLLLEFSCRKTKKSRIETLSAWEIAGTS
jgi:hypothetical protein